MSSESDLQKALRLVREGAARIARHHELIAELRAEGQSATIAERILAEFEKIQSARLTELGKFGAKARATAEKEASSAIEGSAPATSNVAAKTPG
jgi:hypothetical protein